MLAENLVEDAIDLSIGGMTCSGCVKAVSRALSQVPGVTGVAVDFDAGRARVEGSASVQKLVHAIEQAGFDAGPAQDTKQEQSHGHGGCGCGC